MAPELALRVLRDLPEGSTVVDPMCGSGSVIRYAADLGHTAIGADVDPLAVLMARVWTRPVDRHKVQLQADQVISEASQLDREGVHLPWIDGDAETSRFVDYWFGAPQQADLRRLALILREYDGPEADILRLALSRIIVTKDRGASLARDVSHSRPHRVIDLTDYDVFCGYRYAIERIVRALELTPPGERAQVFRQDARHLYGISAGTVDCVLTSPPYLNAIDYIRGHRLALVWLGYKMLPLREIRGTSIGAERGLENTEAGKVVHNVLGELDWWARLTSRYQGIFHRYVLDLHRMVAEFKRILAPSGRVVLVIGNSTLKGVFVRTSDAIRLVCEAAQFELVSESTRKIPPNRRYLPPPSKRGESALKNRMRTEVVLTFKLAI